MTDLTSPIFQDAEKAREHLEKTRWPNGPVCPHCGVVNEATYVGGKAARVGVYQCNACREQFTVTVGTVFESSKVPLNKWLLATYLMSSSKKGISAHQLHRTLGVTYKTAWFMAHRIREAMNPAEPPKLGGAGKVVEADETYVAKAHNKHANKRKSADLEAEMKQKVVTLVERDGGVRSHHVADVTSKTLGYVIRMTADRASHLMTDGWKGYTVVGREFAAHSSVDHSAGEYVRRLPPLQHGGELLLDPEARDRGDLPPRLGSAPCPLSGRVRLPLLAPLRARRGRHDARRRNPPLHRWQAPHLSAV
jgi:transposase-like protein